MTILRIRKKQNNFVIIDKTCFHENKLSWGAKGLHGFLISMPDDWQVRVSDLQKRALNGRDAVRAFLNELEGLGYIKRSKIRNDKTGRFGGMEYLVFETPQLDFEEEIPQTGNQSLVVEDPEAPRVGDPEAGIPQAGNPPLLSINRINNKTAADIKAIQEHPKQAKNAAAVIIDSQEALIGETLTVYQQQRINVIVLECSPNNIEKLSQEIKFCLLNPKSFTACGRDFARKLNAIRAVIKRGDWLIPSGMVNQGVDVRDAERKVLIQALNKAMGDKIHSEKMLAYAHEEAKSFFNNHIAACNDDISALELKLRIHQKAIAKTA